MVWSLTLRPKGLPFFLLCAAALGGTLGPQPRLAFAQNRCSEAWQSSRERRLEDRLPELEAFSQAPAGAKAPLFIEFPLLAAWIAPFKNNEYPASDLGERLRFLHALPSRLWVGESRPEGTIYVVHPQLIQLLRVAETTVHSLPGGQSLGASRALTQSSSFDSAGPVIQVALGLHRVTESYEQRREISPEHAAQVREENLKDTERSSVFVVYSQNGMGQTSHLFAAIQGMIRLIPSWKSESPEGVLDVELHQGIRLPRKGPGGLTIEVGRFWFQENVTLRTRMAVLEHAVIAAEKLGARDETELYAETNEAGARVYRRFYGFRDVPIEVLPSADVLRQRDVFLMQSTLGALKARLAGRT